MTGLRAALADYLALRNRLGHELADAARLLPRFVDWMEHAGQSTVTINAAMRWSQQPTAGPGSVIWAHRMTAVRGFARYLRGIDPDTEVPPLRLLPEPQRWQPPFIYTPADIAALLAAAGRLPTPRRAATYQTLFALLAVTGMRVGEAIRLDTADVDWDQGVLLIRQSKFGKSRHVPLHPSGVDALRDCAARREEYRPLPGNDSFFVSLTGRRLIYPPCRTCSGNCAPNRDRRRIGAATPDSRPAARLRRRAPCSTGTATATTCGPAAAAVHLPRPRTTRRPRTGITPILGLFRRPPLRTLDGPGTWADALWLLSPVGIMRCHSFSPHRRWMMSSRSCHSGSGRELWVVALFAFSRAWRFISVSACA